MQVVFISPCLRCPLLSTGAGGSERGQLVQAAEFLTFRRVPNLRMGNQLDTFPIVILTENVLIEFLGKIHNKKTRFSYSLYIFVDIST